jgi:hypothetical protein
MALHEVCQVLDVIDGSFTLQNIVDRAIEMDPPIDLDVKKIGAGVASLSHIGGITELGYAPHSRAKLYEKNPEISNYVEAEAAGKFKGLYSQYRDHHVPRATTLAKRGQPQPEVEPEPEMVEIDPVELCKALGWDGFVAVWKFYMDDAMADAEAMREQAERIEADARYVQGMKEQDDRAHQDKINDLNRQLKEERERIINLQGEVSRAHAGVRREEAPKILYQRGVQGGMQHGVTTGGPSREVRHGTGAAYTNHAPASVMPKVKVEYKKK